MERGDNAALVYISIALQDVCYTSLTPRIPPRRRGNGCEGTGTEDSQALTDVR